MTDLPGALTARLFTGFAVIAGLLVGFVVLTDVLAWAYAQEVGLLLFACAMPWPILIGALAGYGKLTGLVALGLGLSANWTALVLGQAWWRRRHAPRSLFGR